MTALARAGPGLELNVISAVIRERSLSGESGGKLWPRNAVAARSPAASRRAPVPVAGQSTDHRNRSGPASGWQIPCGVVRPTDYRQGNEPFHARPAPGRFHVSASWRSTTAGRTTLVSRVHARDQLPAWHARLYNTLTTNCTSHWPCSSAPVPQQAQMMRCETRVRGREPSRQLA